MARDILTRDLAAMIDPLAAFRHGASCAVLAFAPTALAQGPVPLAADAFATGIHAGAGAAHGTWVSGADFKASFHDGFVFYPLLGADYARNLPLRWTTLGVDVGGIAIAPDRRTAPTSVGHAQVRFDRGGFVEVYDVRRDGIEQSFVFERAPAFAGDLVVTGRLTTELSAQPVGAAHQALSFRGPAGEAVVSYGAAMAFDARGRRVDVTTAWDGERVELRIAADFVADAVFPVTLDPLIARVGLGTSPSPVRDVDLIRAPVGNGSQLLLVYSRVFAGNDVDSFARTFDAGFGNAQMVFSDVDASRSTKGGRCAYVGDTGRWAMVFERELFAPTTSQVQTYFHTIGNPTTNSGTSATLPLPAGNTGRNPDVGGRRAGGGDNVYVVYQTDPTTTQASTDNTEVWGVLVDSTTAMPVSPAVELDWFPSGTTYDREHPTVVKMSEGQNFWIVAWHELFREATPDDWDINVTRHTFTGQKMAQRYRFGLGAHPWNKRFPRIAGGGDRYLLALTFGSSTAGGEEIQVQRFDWPSAQWDPTMAQPATVAVDLQTPDHVHPDVAFDSNTLSHWAVSYRRDNSGDLFVARVASDGDVLESRSLFASAAADGGAHAVTFVPENGGSFAAAYATDEANYPLFGTALQYPAGAQNTPYGIGCGGTISATPPYIGSQFFTVSLTGGFPSLPAILAASASPAGVSVPPMLPGCYFNVAEPWILLSEVAGPTGDAAITFPIPTSLAAGSTLFFQWAYLDNVMGSIGIATSAGLESRFE